MPEPRRCRTTATAKPASATAAALCALLHLESARRRQSPCWNGVHGHWWVPSGREDGLHQTTLNMVLTVQQNFGLLPHAGWGRMPRPHTELDRDHPPARQWCLLALLRLSSDTTEVTNRPLHGSQAVRAGVSEKLQKLLPPPSVLYTLHQTML